MAPKRATTSKALAGGKPTKKAKKQQQDDEERQDDFFLDSDDDRRSDDEGNEEDVETAEEKRLRLGTAQEAATYFTIVSIATTQGSIARVHGLTCIVIVRLCYALYL
jgi:hypothetical protein